MPFAPTTATFSPSFTINTNSVNESRRVTPEKSIEEQMQDFARTMEECARERRELMEELAREKREALLVRRPKLTEKPAPDDWWHCAATDLDWEHGDYKDKSKPRPNRRMYTVVGRIFSDGKAEKMGNDEHWLYAVKKFRQAGYDVQLIPDWWYKEKEETTRSMDPAPQKRPRLERDRDADELEFLKEGPYDYDESIGPLDVKDKHGNVVVRFDFLDTMAAKTAPWFVVNCPTLLAARSIIDQVDWSYYDGTMMQCTVLPHRRFIVAKKEIDGVSYTVVCTTGLGKNNQWDNGDDRILPTSMYRMYRDSDGKLVAKALCYYTITVGCRSYLGPTVELIEVAKPLRGKGLGVALMQAVKEYSKELFVTLDSISLYIHEATSSKAQKWFEKKLNFDLIEGYHNNFEMCLWSSDTILDPE
jgi:GNAT superfamily N-acetyltransferase